MKKKKYLKFTLLVVIIIFLLGSIDYYKVSSLKEKPLFCIGTHLEKDGGSGTYIGLGYAYKIKSVFIQKEEVDTYEFYILGIKIKSTVSK